MKNAVLSVVAALVLVSASGAVQAQGSKIQHSRDAVAFYNSEAPRILNDRVCVKMCDTDQNACDPLAFKKTDGRCNL